MICDAKAPDDPALLEQRRIYGQAERMYAKVEGQLGELPALKARYADRWPAVLDIDALRDAMARWREALDIYREALARVKEPLPALSADMLMELLGRLVNSRDLIADNISDFLMDGLMKEAARNAGIVDARDC